MIPTELEPLVCAARDNDMAAISALADLLWERHDARLTAAVLARLARPGPCDPAGLSLVEFAGRRLPFRLQRVLCVQFLEQLGYPAYDRSVPVTELCRFSGVELQGRLRGFGESSLRQLRRALGQIGLRLRSEGS